MSMRNIYIQVTLLTICIKTFQITYIAHLNITLLYILILVCLITKAGVLLFQKDICVAVPHHCIHVTATS